MFKDLIGTKTAVGAIVTLAAAAGIVVYIVYPPTDQHVAGAPSTPGQAAPAAPSPIEGTAFPTRFLVDLHGAPGKPNKPFDVTFTCDVTLRPDRSCEVNHDGWMVALRREAEDATKVVVMAQYAAAVGKPETRTGLSVGDLKAGVSLSWATVRLSAKQPYPFHDSKPIPMKFNAEVDVKNGPKIKFLCDLNATPDMSCSWRDPNKGQVVYRFQRHAHAVTAIAFSLERPFAISGSFTIPGIGWDDLTKGVNLGYYVLRATTAS